MRWFHTTHLTRSASLLTVLLLTFLTACQVPPPPEVSTGAESVMTVVVEEATVAPTNTAEPITPSIADVPRITVQDTKARLDAGNAVIVDVRTIGEYERGHIPGAVVIPRSEIEDRFAELPEETEILLYCT